jgi:cation-transporting ATPase F
MSESHIHDMERIRKKAHSISADELLKELGTDPRSGLDPEVVGERIKKWGPNALVIEARDGPVKKFILQFHQPLLYILMAAALAAVFLGEHVDAAVIFAVVFANALIGFIQEFRAEKEIEALARMVPTGATVIRSGSAQRVDAAGLVPGDVILLESGDSVPADLRLIDTKNLQVDESALTGESLPVSKTSLQLPDETVLADRTNCAFSGTLVTHGRGRGVVVSTGNHTETGKIARLVRDAVEISTPLTRKIAEFSKLLLWAILALSVVLFSFGLWQGRGVFEMFMASIALAVGAIPEGLPAAVTIALAIGVARMARRRAIIRKLPAVETLGSTTVICSDKTGTLTENQMTVTAIFAGGHSYEITGSGYGGAGEVVAGNDAPDQNEALRQCLLAGLLCNDSHLRLNEGLHEVVGDPTEAALLVSASKAGLERESLEHDHPRVDHIPFESEHQYMATLHRVEGSGERMIYKKGSLERVLSRCDSMLNGEGQECPLDPSSIHRVAGSFAARGLRVLAFARRHHSMNEDSLKPEHVEAGLVFLGIQAMIDPPRPEAIKAVAQCQSAGIRVKMITGDHPGTALAVARTLGIAGGDHQDAITGATLERMSEEELAEKAASTHVFARVAPEQKLLLVRALQAQNQIVAMTGDGVNDAPSLRQADIGIAMGKSGTDVAKNAADMILTDDNFASIEAAVEEGRGVFDNLRKFIMWIIPTNAGVALVLMISVFFGLELPALPVQLLWLNLTAAVLLGLALVFEPLERGVMARAPRDPSAPLLDWPILARTGLVSFMMILAAFAAYFYVLERGGPIESARTAVVNAFLSICAFYLLGCRSMKESIFTVGWLGNRWIWVGIASTVFAQFLFSQTPWMNRLFHTAPLSWSEWLLILLMGAVSLLVVEFEKWVRRRTNSV